jgi:hypothetical protein
MPRATSILREKVIDEEGNIVELAIWRVPVTPRAPLGVRYRLAFVRVGDTTPAVLYDNHHPKGSHRHIEGAEEPYAFRDVDALLTDFQRDVRRIKRAGR